jgi:quinol-cytochrome oxidoreductase complex cytochrome b subunit/mono/diheme cytochrome c family protein
VLAKLRDWFDNRTGYRKLISVLLIEHIPGGAKWRYVWGSCLAFVFSVQLITGLLLMTAYSPGDSTAWGSVYFIQYQMDFGWLIRGLHHFGSQTMVVLLGLHMLQVVIAGAHLPPREINWWLGLMLLGAVLALSLTGYLLPWDQKGYWATQVATNIAGNLPGLGAWIQKVVVGGPAYGHHTLTRFYALHVGILPAVVIALTILHLTVFRRHKLTTPKDAEGEGWFWPDQAFKDLVVSLLIFGVMLALVVMGHGNPIPPDSDAPTPSLYERWAHAGREGLGANLDAPADPARPYPARPEWYFLFLFQLLKYFEGPQEIIGTVIIPNGVLVLLALLPLLGYGRMRGFGHVFGVVVVTGLLVGVASLTCQALADDMVEPIDRWLVRRIGTVLMPAAGAVLLFVLGVMALLRRGALRSAVGALGVVILGILLLGSGSLLLGAINHRLRPEVKEWVAAQLTEEDKEVPEAPKTFQKQQEEAEEASKRAVIVADIAQKTKGILAGGAIHLLRRDPMTQGKRLFGEHCAVCHTHDDDFPNKKPTAPDLAGFGTKEFNLRLLEFPGGPQFFGRVGRTVMQDVIDELFPNVALPPEHVAKLDPADQKKLKEDRRDLRLLADWLARHPRPTSPDRDSPEFKAGQQLFVKRTCNGCHAYAGKGGTRTSRGPDLTGYGDAEWVRLMIMAPASPARYGTTNTMPAFRDLEGQAGVVAREEMDQIKRLLRQQPKKPKGDIDKAHRLVNLPDVDRELILRWLLKDERVVFGGEPIAEQ